MSSLCDFAVSSAMATHVGTVRRHNEDSCLDRREIGLWVVADGMGGHEAGDVASRLIVESLSGIGQPADAATLLTDVRERLNKSNLQLLDEAARRGTGIVGSTVVALLAHGTFFACLWAGDSRLYRMRNGALEQLTRDHSQIWEMIEAGVIDAEAAEHHPLANVITRAVGVDSELVLDKLTDRVQPEDLFLLCSDGLSKMVSDREIAEILRGMPISAIPEALIAAALAHGGRDNITAIAVLFGERLVQQGSGY
jgi:serine/threonine protein phosphatase PrpC